MIPLSLDTITTILLVVFLACGIGVLIIGMWLYRQRAASKRESRLSRFASVASDADKGVPSRRIIIPSEKEIGKFRDWINKSLRSLSSEKLQIKLSSAYWAITDTEYILIRVAVTVLAFFLGWLLPDNFLVGIFLAVVAFLVPPMVLERAISKRRRDFHTQLLDTLVLITGAVQAGYSLMQSLDLAVKEISPPASDEFARVLHEIRLGFTLETALFNLAERMESDDLQIVITAIIINSQVGGNLSTVLEATISTIRDRMHLQGEIRSLTSYARYVGNFLTLLPFILFIAIFFLSPGYFDTVQSSLFTQVVFLVALLGIIIGNIWVRRLVRIRV